LFVYPDSEGEGLVVAIYVDDIILGGSCEGNLNQMKLELIQKFEIKDLGQLHHFLGVKVIQNQPGGLIWIGQPSYIDKILHSFDMHESKPVDSPVNCDVKLVPCDNPVESANVPSGSWKPFVFVY